MIVLLGILVVIAGFATKRNPLLVVGVAGIVTHRFAGLTTGRFLTLYLGLRQLTAAFGLNSLGGPAQTVRPLVAPMAEGAFEKRHGPLPEQAREKVRSFSSSADTVGLFFGEDCFLAVGSILLITGFVNTTYGQHLEPLQLALWTIPTAVCAFLVHGARLLRLDRSLVRAYAGPGGTDRVLTGTGEAAK